MIRTSAFATVIVRSSLCKPVQPWLACVRLDKLVEASDPVGAPKRRPPPVAPTLRRSEATGRLAGPLPLSAAPTVEVARHPDAFPSDAYVVSRTRSTGFSAPGCEC